MSTCLVEYVNFRNPFGYTPLFGSIGVSPGVVCSPRVVQLLVDAGADTAYAFRDLDRGEIDVSETPLALINRFIRENNVWAGEEATEEQLHGLEAVRRLLMRVEAVHAVSWLWHTDAPIAQRIEHDGTSNAETVSTPLRIYYRS